MSPHHLGSILSSCLVLAAAPNDVKGTMRGNLAALVTLQPLLVSPEAFADPKNAAAVRGSIAVLARTRHRFQRPQTQEPAAALSALFAESVSWAESDLTAGRPESARLRLRGATSLCLQCHARQLSAADFTRAGRSADGAGLPPLERADFFAATRQFDAALALWGDALSRPPSTDAEVFEQLRAFRAALSVAVRAKDDPKAAIALLEGRCTSSVLSASSRRDCVRQLNDAKSWAAERLDAASAGGAALYARASELIDVAELEGSVYPREEDRVKLLRATAYLSLALEREPKAPWRGDALFALGLATGATLDPDLWALDGIYLEACVREQPHTPLARRCAGRLAERTLLDFTGSGGTRLPDDVARRLEALRELAR
ncbi:MAG: hypothetical protein JNK82_12345 [Myxococcaceae bacterium]|nr:hypothetical protein [Myxococcaceae bacterium]